MFSASFQSHYFDKHIGFGISDLLNRWLDVQAVESAQTDGAV